MEASKILGIGLNTLCGGKGTCGKCKVKVQKGMDGLNSWTEMELKHLSQAELNENTRLACQTILTHPSIIFVPLRSRVGIQRLQTEGLEVSVTSNPLVKKYFVHLPPPTLHDPRADEDRLLDALKQQHSLSGLTINFNVAQRFPIILRKAKWSVTTVIWKNEIIAVESNNTVNRCFGFAMDIGSTKLAGFLMNLITGDVVSVAARMNPQIPLGEDIMSRISYAMMNGWEGQKELQTAVITGVNEIIEECCEKADVKPEEIYELNFVGNTAMQLLFLGLWSRYVALSPYPPVLRKGVDVPAVQLGLRAHLQANAHYVPIIGGFVGADNIAVILASKMLESEDIIMAIDIGTNTEIDLGNKDLIMADSCASGPAFEGMEIKFGMRAASGSIEKISIAPETLDVYYQTIENTSPVGICGSGLVDATAELFKSNIIDIKGTFRPKIAEKSHRLRRSQDGWEFVIAWKDETTINADIVLTQGDIRELQKAKAAIHAGAEILLQRMELTEHDISKLVVAGAFGNYIDPENARTIGMYPDIPLEKVEFVGNLAGTGARMSLISKEMREYTETISKKVKYLELAIDKNFQDEYLNSFYFPHANLNKYPLTVELLRRIGRIL
jgi:uncharacterized 2Fe-2S/4Fe-4S cluster protein (DUF4445 family)